MSDVITNIGEMELLEAAKVSAGNWKSFTDFAWYDADEVDSAEDWALVYTHNRDSGLLAQSNADQIAEALKPYLEADSPDIHEEHHSHWACGWVDGYAIRVYDAQRNITPAFIMYHDLMRRLADYPILCDLDHSQKEYDATIENIQEIARSVNCEDDYELADWKVEDVFNWLWENEQEEVENVDDSGGYPSEDSVRRAFDALGYKVT